MSAFTSNQNIPYWATKVLLEIVGAAARILFLWLLLTSPPDQKCFMLKVITKLVTLIYLPFALAMVIAFGEASTLVFIGFHDSFFAALFFALLGIERTLALPFGKRLLHVCLVYFVWEGCVMTGGTEPILLEWCCKPLSPCHLFFSVQTSCSSEFTGCRTKSRGMQAD